MNTKELIEKQIETSGNCLARVESEFSATGRVDGASLIMFCGGLFQIVQNQQAQIEGLQGQNEHLEATLDGLQDYVLAHKEAKR